MKKNLSACITSMTLLAAPAIPLRPAAQEEKKGHARYKLIDLGTFGGHNSENNFPGGIRRKRSSA